MSARLSRRRFLIGAGAGGAALALGLSRLQWRDGGPAAGGTEAAPAAGPGVPVAYSDVGDVYRAAWRWDRVVKGTHNRTNCISACSWNLFVRDGIVWREEQNAIYEPPRADVPDMNPRGCQKGACYSDLQLSEARVLHPLKRVGPRGSGRFRRVSWDEALDAIADGLIDVAETEGTESILHDHGTTNVDFGPDTAGELRFAAHLNSTVIDSWAGVGDMPMGAVQTWGLYNCEGTSDDWFRSDYIIVWIGNPSYTRIPEVHFMHEARYRGARLVVVAPDLNATAVHADLWVAPRPETDPALALTLAQVIVEEGLHDADYIREQTDLPLLVREDTGRLLREADRRAGGREDLFYFADERNGELVAAPGCVGEGGGSLALGGARPALEGQREVRLKGGRTVAVRPVFARLKEHLQSYTPEESAAVTGVSPGVTRGMARELAGAGRAMIFASWGACKHYHSDLFQRAAILLMALTGNQGKAGGGLRIAAWWDVKGFEWMAAAEPQISLMDKLRIFWKYMRGMTARDYEELYTEFTRKRSITPLMPFLYVHGGYGDLWRKSRLQDPALPRGIDDYVQEAIDRGWLPMHPAPERPPRAFIFTGANPLRRWPAPQLAREGLWPKLDLVVAVTFRMTTSALHADYVLPSAAYYEKWSVKYGQTYVPYLMIAEQAVPPRGESRSDWEIFGRLAERVQQRARKRGVGKVRGSNDEPLDLSTLFERWTRDGDFDPADPIVPMKEILDGTPIIGDVSLEEACRVGAVRIVKPGGFAPLHQTCTDYRPDDTYAPHRWFVDGKQAWPTLSGRQQFFLDHPWYEEAGEVLPVHKDPPGAQSGLPLRLTGGHTRWSVHAIWRDHDLLLRLQRGEPAGFLSPPDAHARGIRDGDRVRVRNETGSFDVIAKVAAGVPAGEVIVYHAWEPYQFAGWRSAQDPVEAPWKPLHLAGGYGHLHYRMYYGAPSHAPRGAPVEVERLARAGEGGAGGARRRTA